MLSAKGRQGGSPKAHNQDFAFLEEVPHPLEPGSPCGAATLVGVFDGHGRQGHACSAHVGGALRAAVPALAARALVEASGPGASWGGNSASWDASATFDGFDEPAGAFSNGRCATALAAEGRAAPRAGSSSSALPSSPALTPELAAEVLERSFELAAESVEEAHRAAALDASASGCTAVLCMVTPHQ